MRRRSTGRAEHRGISGSHLSEHDALTRVRSRHLRVARVERTLRAPYRAIASLERLPDAGMLSAPIMAAILPPRYTGPRQFGCHRPSTTRSTGGRFKGTTYP